MSEICKDFVYRGYNVKYHSEDGMLQVIWYEVLEPSGKKLGKVYSADEAKTMIDKKFERN